MDVLPTSNALGAFQIEKAKSLGLKSESASKDGAEDVAAEFESLFVSLLLKEMRSTLQDGLFGGESSDSYGGLFDMYLGRHLAQAGGIGLKDAVSGYIQPKVNDNDPSSITPQ